VEQKSRLKTNPDKAAFVCAENLKVAHPVLNFFSGHNFIALIRSLPSPAGRLQIFQKAQTSLALLPGFVLGRKGRTSAGN
jgi:hypothetical protein